MPQRPGSEVKHFSAPVAQLDRVPGYELGGREFESLRAHHFIKRGGVLAPRFVFTEKMIFSLRKRWSRNKGVLRYGLTERGVTRNI